MEGENYKLESLEIFFVLSYVVVKFLHYYLNDIIVAMMTLVTMI